jgi:uncharacterized protein with PIN domain
MPAANLTMKLRLSLGGSYAFFRFYGELNDFLTPDHRGCTLVHRFDVSPSIKDAIETLGIPHPEVELIVANHEPVDFSYLLRPGDYVSVFPAFHSIDLGSTPQLRPRPETPPRFVLDVHLGRLSGYLRLLGFDTLYRNDLHDAEIARLSASEGRIVLTRDRGLLKRNEVTYGYWVRHMEPRKQLLELLRRFDLATCLDLFTRCLICNTCLIRVGKEKVAERLPARTAEHFEDFHLCPQCQRVYWKGSHYRRMLRLVGRTLREARR